MNISSILVKTRVGEFLKVLEILKNADYCEVHFYENEKIVVTIEGEKLDEEIRSLHTIEKLQGVRSAELVYSYSEDELDKEREKVEFGSDVPEWLNDEKLKAEQITYKGDLKKKL